MPKGLIKKVMGLLRHSCRKIFTNFFTNTGQYIIPVNAFQSACSGQFVDVVVQILEQ